MATHRMPIIGWQTIPDNSGNVFFEPYTIKATNDVFRHGHISFNNTSTKDGVYGVFNVPKNYVGTASIIVVWTTTATTGDVVWDFDYRAVGGNDSESLDQASFQESVTATDTAPSAANERMEVAISVTSSNIAADDTVEFQFSRDGAAAGDTMAAVVQLVDLLFQYSDA